MKNNIPLKKQKMFLQPIAVALVCLVFALLFFSTAFIQIRRLESTLQELLQREGVTIIEEFIRLSQKNFNYLNGEDNGSIEMNMNLNGLGEGFTVRESLVWELMDIAREIDVKAEDPLFSSNDDIRELASKENLGTIVIIDNDGKILFQSGPINGNLLTGAQPLIKGKDEILIDLFKDQADQNSPGLIGIRRKSGNGTIIIILDGKNIKYWKSRTAVQVAAEEKEWGENVRYLMVMDANGNLIGGIGDISNRDWAETTLLPLDMDRSSRWLKSASISVLETYAPLKFNNQATGKIILGLDGERIDNLLRKNRDQIFLSLGLMLLIGIIAVWLLYRNQNQHLSRIQQMSDKLNQAERLSSLGQLAAGVAHEIRNPLNAISMAAQRIQREFGPPEEDIKRDFTQLTGIIRDEIRRLNRIIEDFLSLSRSRFNLRSQSIIHLLEETASLFEGEAEAKNIVIKKQWNNSDYMVYMDMDKMKQALLNLIKNAIESIPDKGTIILTLVSKSSTSISILITDTGRGISPDDIMRVFDPNYTTKEKGLGLGLQISYEIIRAHKGELLVKSDPNREGTTFEIILPCEGKMDINKGQSL